MFPEETRNRQEKLAKEILELAENMLDIQKEEHLKVIRRLQMIYRDEFKHSYSDLFPVILKVFQERDQYDVNFLSNNIETIRNELEKDFSDQTNQFGDIYAKFTKLCDHLNLQISQISIFFEMEDKKNDANALVNEANKKLQTATKNFTNASEKVNSLQTELIAVLSIFAAIVITFSGGISFLGSVMTSIKDVEHFESVILAAIVCGLVVFNTVFLMMYMVSKITGRSIYSRCKDADKKLEDADDEPKELSEKGFSCGCENHDYNCSGIKRIRRRLPYVFYFNLFAVIGIVIDLIIWFLNENYYF